MIGNLVGRREETNNEAVQWTDLRTRRTFARLAFAVHVYGLVAGNCAPSSPEEAEILTCADPALDRPMILFQNVIQVLHRLLVTVCSRAASALTKLDHGCGLRRPWC
jgi:hypothetical protein